MSIDRTAIVQLERMFRRLKAEIRDEVLEQVNARLANVIRGGLVRADRVSGIIPGTAPSGAEYVVTASHVNLSAERLLSDVIARGPLANRPAAGVAGRLYYATDDTTLYRDNGITWESVEGEGGGGGGGAIRTTYASRPAPGVAGRLWLQSDGVYTAFDDGSEWHEYALGYPVIQPDSNDFSWVNQGGATLDTTNGGIYLHAPGHGNTPNCRILAQTAPSTPYTITAYLIPNLLEKNFTQVGLLFRESTTGALATLGQFTSGSIRLQAAKWNSATSFNVAYTEITTGDFYHWLRIADDGANRICSVSRDGMHWIDVHSVLRTNFLTADQVGFFVNAQNQNTPNLDAGAWLLSWEAS